MKRFKLPTLPLLAVGLALPLLAADTPNTPTEKENAYFTKVDLTQGETSKHFRDWPDGKSPTVIGKKVSENFLPREN